jgi:eukaryotic-like serine/threonine-protein kinase
MWDKRARQAASRALELDPELAEAHEALAALYRYTDFDWELTIDESRKALYLNSNLGQPHFYIAWAYKELGLVEFIEPEVLAGLEINPDNRVEAAHLRIFAALFSGQFAKAAALSEDMVRLSEGTRYPEPHVHYYNGEEKRAEALLNKKIEDKVGGNRQQLYYKAILASFLAARGARAQAKAILRDITSDAETFHHASYNIGVAYAQLGDRAKARLWLARAANTGFPCYPWYDRDPLLKPLRGDPEFQRFMEGLKLDWEAAKKKYAPDQK